MGSVMTFDYFYGTESDMLTFYRIPKLLVTDDYFRNISTDAKLLYGLMLDRMSLSAKNNWFDSKKRVYIYFSLEDTMYYLHCGRNKALRIFDELDEEKGIGLIARRKQGQGKPAMIYVKNFTKREAAEGSEVYISNPNKNKYNNTESNRTDLISDPIGSTETDGTRSEEKNTPVEERIKQEQEQSFAERWKAQEKKQSDAVPSDSHRKRTVHMPDVAGYADLIHRNIEYESLLQSFPYERETIDGICDLILETVLSTGDSIVIASNRFPTELVKSRLLKLDYSHIAYVLESMKKNTTCVRNIRKYMLAALFNAPTTISSYYQAEVNHDMPQFAG